MLREEKREKCERKRIELKIKDKGDIEVKGLNKCQKGRNKSKGAKLWFIMGGGKTSSSREGVGVQLLDRYSDP
jgi:hypothetical protein